MENNALPSHLRDTQEEKTQVAALFEAPVQPGEDAASAADPLHQLDDAEREGLRIRGMPVNEIVLEYLGVRDNLDDERHKYQALEARLKDKLSMMSMIMREKADALGVDAFPIRGVGTAYRNAKVSYRVASWEDYVKWLIQTNNFQCVEKRAAKLAVQEVHRATGEVPPGLDVVTEVEFLVRRSKA